MNRKILSLLCCVYQCCLANAVELTIDPSPIVEDAERIGINLGTWTTWGAEQFSKNILMNPGFEGYVDRIIVIVSQADKSSFSDDPDWGYDDDYWKGAFFEVRTGTAKGTIGKITHSLRKGAKGLPQYVTEKPLPELSPKDIITLTKLSDEDPVPLWWIGDGSKERVHVDKGDKRPLSTGVQSLALEPKPDNPAEINYYLDAITDRAGKLLPINGQWRLSFWMKSDTPDNNLHVAFHRINGTPPFVEQIIPAATDWKEYTFDFNAQDKGDPQTLQLKIAAVGAGGKVWIDDIFLGPVQPGNSTNFRQEVVEMLKKINPSYIRDTQGQLGDTFHNRIADIYARRAVSSRAFAGNRSLSTGYSIPDLLELCKTVHANPWIVVPPTFTDEEGLQLGQYLAQHANKDIFKTVVVEFGNENWNWVFRATGIPHPHEHGLVADKVFQHIEQGAGNAVNLMKVVNGQHASPNISKEFAQSTPNADTLAIAPYFFTTIDAGSSQQDNLKSLFQDDGGLMKQLATLLRPLQKRLAVYEVNLHTDKGTSPSAERDSYTSGQAAGSALAKRLLEGMQLGIQPEIVFSLSQFDTDTIGGHGKAKLWGITRDLGATNRMRPQGLALVMLNAIIDGSLHKVAPSDGGSTITAVAFQHKGQWKAAVVNASQDPQTAKIKFPEGSVPTSLWVLHAKSPLDTNESKENVTITTKNLEAKGSTVEFTIPPWGLVVLNDSDRIP